MLSLGLISKVRRAVSESRTISDCRYIYLVDEDKVAKRFWKGDSARNDYKIGKFLYENGVRVPRYYGVTSPDLRLLNGFFSTPLYHWYLVMERIDGTRLRDVGRDDLNDVIDMHRREIEKIIALGVYPVNFIYINDCVVSKKDGLVYLLDFCRWGVGRGQSDEWRLNLDRFYESLSDRRLYGSGERSEPGGI